MRIYKYRFRRGSFAIDLPKVRIFRHIGIQDGEIFAWFEVDHLSEIELACRFFMVGTGTDTPYKEEATYLGTVFDGPFVWHFYEAKR